MSPAPLRFEDVDSKVTIALLARAFHVGSAWVWGKNIAEDGMP